MPVPASEDPVLHTVQTVGRLSNKISRRVYRNVSRQIRKMQKGNINDYLSSLIAALKLHQYINFINSSMASNLDQSILNSDNTTTTNTNANANINTNTNTTNLTRANANTATNINATGSASVSVPSKSSVKHNSSNRKSSERDL